MNANNWYNKGDVSNRVGLINSLRKSFGNDISICIESRTPDEDSSYFHEFGADVIESVYHVNDCKRGGLIESFDKLFAILVLIFCFVMYRCFGYVSESTYKSSCFFKNLVNADIVISSPGGFLQDYHIYQSLLPHIFLIFLAQCTKKPVIIYAQSVGPFNNPITRLSSKIVFNRAALITLRENISKEYLKNAGVDNPRIYVTADSSFSFSIPPFDRAARRKEILNLLNVESDRPFTLVGLSILGEYFFTSKRFPLLNDYAKSVASLIDHLSENINARIILIPQVVSKTEFAVMKLILQKVNHRDHVLKLNNDFSPQEIMKLIGCMDIMIGNRTHSCIYALNMNVPVVAIAYEHKTLGIMSMLNLETWVVDISDVSSKIISKVDELYSCRHEVSKHIAGRVPDLKRKSMSNANLVLEFLSSEAQHYK